TEKSKTEESPSAEKSKPAESPSIEKPKPAAADESNDSSVLDIAHRIVYGVKTVLPKTTETIALLERSLVRLAKLPQPRGPQTERMQAAQLEFIEILHARSIAWVVGTSLGFEGFVLFWAALFFCRRNY
ncbi:MAG: hypothetical protein ABSE63_15205, partial [Thermoguttaceae bacterium]